jgi:hypothetical protein
MKKNLALSFFFFAGIGLMAQEVDLSKFALPEYKRNELFFDFRSSGYRANEIVETDDGASFRKDKNFSLSNSSDISYRRYSNTERYQGNLLTSLSLDFPNISGNSFSIQGSETKSKSRHSYINFSAYSINRFYSKSKWYFEADPNIQLSSSWYQSIYRYRYSDPAQNNDFESETSHLSGNVSTDFRIGKGRIEPVEDLRQTLYILDGLKKAGRLKRDLTQDETVLLAKKFSALKNRRFLDSRLRLIEEMIEIEKIMNEMDLVSDNDAVCFATVNDYWSMTANPSRSAGSRLSLGIKPFYSSDDVDASNSISYFNPDSVFSTENHTMHNNYSIYLNASYERYKPLNLYWQQDFSAEIFTQIYSVNDKNLTFDNSTGYNMYFAGAKGFYRLNYYPNSRTNYSGIVDISYKNGTGTEKAPITEDVKYKSFNGNLSLGTTYYFSPHLTLMGSAGVRYSDSYNTTTLFYSSVYPKINGFDWSFSLNLVYKLF